MDSLGGNAPDNSSSLGLVAQSNPHLTFGPPAMESHGLNGNLSTDKHPTTGHHDVPHLAGRKRSRDEASPMLVHEASKLSSTNPCGDSDGKPQRGEGMPLVGRVHGYTASANGQPEKREREKADLDSITCAATTPSHVTATQRPYFRSNKSQRLGQGPGLLLETQPNSVPAVNGHWSHNTTNIPNPSSSSPVVDDFTLHLGIGWRRLSDDEHIQAAARGWARFIENHYPISSVNIRLESSGLQAYLVESAEGFYLFAEDLRQGRLVSTNADQALQNLRSSPPVFDAHDTMFAAEKSGEGGSGLTLT